MNIPQDLLYTKDHEWIGLEGDRGRIGISDFAQSHLGDIVYIELPELDAAVAQGDPIGVIESVKAVANMYCPAGGTIVEINAELEEAPELLNEDPYANWVAVVELSAKADLAKLMDARTYAEYCQNQEHAEG